MLTERENALRAIRRDGTPEWVPIAAKCFHFLIPSAILERPKKQDGLDWFGSYWKYDAETDGYAEHFEGGPMLEDVSEWEEIVKFPDLDAIDWKACAEKDLAGYDRDSQILEIFWESGPFERSHHLLGFEGAFIAMYEDPEAYKALLNALTDWKIDAMGRLIEAYKPDMIFTHDDLGSMRAPLMSMDMYREFVKPYHMRLEQFIRSKGVIVDQHSCGMMEPFVGDMIECGADIINCIQGTINNQEKILQEYGDKVSFHGGLSPLMHDPSSTEEQLRAEVRRAIDVFAPYRNFIIDTGSTDRKNAAILLDEAERYGADYWKKHSV